MLTRWWGLALLWGVGVSTGALADAMGGGTVAAGLLVEVSAGLGDATPGAREQALMQYYGKLYNEEDRAAALAIADAVEPLLSLPEERAEFQERVAGVARDAGDLALYERFQGRLETENPDPATEAGYHARYARALVSMQHQDFSGAIAQLEPLLPVSEGISEVQQARLGVQLTNAYRNNGDYDKVIALAEVTRGHLTADDPRQMDLLADLATAYFETGNYELAVLTYDELAALVLRLRPNAQLPEQPAVWRAEALAQGAEARARAEAMHPPKAVLAGISTPAMVDAPPLSTKSPPAASAADSTPMPAPWAEVVVPATDGQAERTLAWPMGLVAVATALIGLMAWLRTGKQPPAIRR